MSADVLSFTIELPDRKYASVNNRSRGFRDPRKSPIYNAVFASVKMHAEDEIDRIGWEKAECECSATIIRVVNRRMRVDASNLGKCEWDAMTEAGVWTDDRLATPVNLQVRYDEDGVNRVIIVVVKLHEPLNVRIVNQPKREPRVKRERGAAPPATFAKDKVSVSSYDGGQIPDGYALMDGKLISRADALAMITKKSA